LIRTVEAIYGDILLIITSLKGDININIMHLLVVNTNAYIFWNCLHHLHLLKTTAFSSYTGARRADVQRHLRIIGDTFSIFLHALMRSLQF
jgi:hypothetical protein